ncbi:RNA-binding motif protein, X chromosome-like [Artibeus jamaicensis]|uniref:RNA-binding motif protein, X chromosome-like n=1 Tax=Artibeus jamaicensis TaxID=9417 RepID=UPI00235A86A9|nr:RNA-binding motif protein, X chromosome-like [Artibeus jamaicensis]
MVEAGEPGKLFIGGLSVETNEKTLGALFGKFGPLTEDGKTLKVQQANTPSFQSRGRQWLPVTSRSRGGARSLQSGRGAGGEGREHPSRGTHLDEGGYALYLNPSSSRRHGPHGRGPRSRSGHLLPPKSATSASRRRSPGMGRRAPRERDNKGDTPCNEPRYSQKGDYRLSRDSAYPTNYSYSPRGYPSFPDTRHDRDYGYKGCWDERFHGRYSSRHGYGGDPDKATSDCGNGGSYRNSFKRDGRWHAAPPPGRPRLMSTGSRSYDDHCSSRQTDCQRGCENYLSRGRDSWCRGCGHGGKCDPGFSPPVWQDAPFHRECCRSSNKGALPMDSWGS